MTIKEEKAALRKEMLQLRNLIKPRDKVNYDLWICSALEALIISKNCKVVHSYIPFEAEIDIIPLLNKLLQINVTVVCPKTLPKRKLENRILYNLNDLEIGIMGTKHPSKEMVYDGKCDLIIVPGLAFDEDKYRLGYGGGYYDNFLTAQPQAYKVGIFYPFQKVEKVPVEPHDIGLDEILTRAI